MKNDYQGIVSANIPNIDVYMDQLLFYFNSNPGISRRKQKEKLLTKSMVNNYVKAGILDKPVKKKYNKSQIKKLIMICELKQVLAINDIKKIFDQTDSSGDYVNSLYEQFLEAEKNSRVRLETYYQEPASEKADDKTLINTILSLATEACAKKQLAEKILDELNSPTSF